VGSDYSIASGGDGTINEVLNGLMLAKKPASSKSVWGYYGVTGSPFRLNPERASLDGEVRQEITNEIMYQLAALLPPAYRGAYSDLSRTRQEYLIFASGVHSNLLRAAI